MNHPSKITKTSAKQKPKESFEQNYFDELVEKYTKEQQLLLRRCQPVSLNDPSGDARRKLDRKGPTKNSNMSTSGPTLKKSLSLCRNGSRFKSKLVQTDPEQSKKNHFFNRMYQTLK